LRAFFKRSKLFLTNLPLSNYVFIGLSNCIQITINKVLAEGAPDGLGLAFFRLNGYEVLLVVIARFLLDRPVGAECCHHSLQWNSPLVPSGPGWPIQIMVHEAFVSEEPPRSSGHLWPCTVLGHAHLGGRYSVGEAGGLISVGREPYFFSELAEVTWRFVAPFLPA